jgi:hypothetical protein
MRRYHRMTATPETTVTTSTAPSLVGMVLVVQIFHPANAAFDARWSDFRKEIAGLFPEEGTRQLEQARTGWPDREFRLIRRTTYMQEEEITSKAQLHQCGNCEGIDPITCLTNPERSSGE